MLFIIKLIFCYDELTNFSILTYFEGSLWKNDFNVQGRIITVILPCELTYTDEQLIMSL